MDQEKRNTINKKGILGWGIFSAVVWSFLMACLKSGSFFEYQFPNWKKFFQFLVVAIPIFSIGGFFQAMFMYKHHQKAAMLPKPKNEMAIKVLIIVLAAVLATLLSFCLIHPFNFGKFFPCFIIAFVVFVFLGFLIASSIYSSAYRDKK